MAAIRLQILSDLHLESPVAYDIFDNNPKAPFLALLGDIGCVMNEGFFHFLRKQLAIFQVVFLVLGNHEAYHSSWTETKSKVKRFKHDIDESSGEVRCLENLFCSIKHATISHQHSPFLAAHYSHVSPKNRRRALALV